MKKDIYEQIPILENEEFLLRAINPGTDTEALWKVYSDKKAVPFFNGDNCHGDTFYYDTMEKMERAIAFWQQSYEDGWFVRWAIVQKKSGQAVGTIELFNRRSADYYNNSGLLRLDLGSAYETEADIGSILEVIVPNVQELFHCDKIATKAVAAAKERIRALEKQGFHASEEVLVGHDGTEYGDYWVKDI